MSHTKAYMVKRNPRIIKRNIEAWSSIQNFRHHEISNMGRVRSFVGEIKILKGIVDKDGYPEFCLSYKRKQKNIKGHTLVISHFGLPKPSPTHQCNHKDGNKSNNWDTNLEWMTSKENTQHAILNELRKPVKGQDHWNAKLSDKKVDKIKRLYKTGNYTQYELALSFNTKQGTISAMVNEVNR
jgi:hypothetical protein